MRFEHSVSTSLGRRSAISNNMQVCMSTNADSKPYLQTTSSVQWYFLYFKCPYSSGIESGTFGPLLVLFHILEMIPLTTETHSFVSCSHQGDSSWQFNLKAHILRWYVAQSERQRLLRLALNSGVTDESVARLSHETVTVIVHPTSFTTILVLWIDNLHWILAHNTSMHGHSRKS